MGLINCPDCGQPVSDRAKACIHCGCPLNEETLSAVKAEPEVKAPAAETTAAQTPVEQTKPVQTPAEEKAPVKEEKVDTKGIIEYLKQAKDLESSVYSQKNVVSKANSSLRLNLPCEPDCTAPQYVSILTKPVMYSKPVKPIKPSFTDSCCIDWFPLLVIIILLLVLLGGPVVLGVLTTASVGFCCGIFFYAIAAVIVYFLFIKPYLNDINEYTKNLESYEQREKQYETDLNYYDERLAEYSKKLEEDNKKREQFNIDAKKEIERKQNEYKEKCQIAENNYSVAQNALSDMNSKLSETEELLNKLYAKDIIFSKYRDMVAICSFYEYFVSGRVSTLEGPDGAYNLYESELRQNLIINRLETISSQLEDIKKNQFMLYSEIKDAINVARDISRKLNSISSATNKIADYSEITTYCSAITASNAQALTYIETANLLLN